MFKQKFKLHKCCRELSVGVYIIVPAWPHGLQIAEVQQEMKCTAIYLKMTGTDELINSM